MWAAGDQVAFRCSYNASGWYTSKDWRNGRIIGLTNQGRTAVVLVRADHRIKDSKDALWDVPTRFLKPQRDPPEASPLKEMSVEEWMNSTTC